MVTFSIDLMIFEKQLYSLFSFTLVTLSLSLSLHFVAINGQKSEKINDLISNGKLNSKLYAWNV